MNNRQTAIALFVRYQSEKYSMRSNRVGCSMDLVASTVTFLPSPNKIATLPWWGGLRAPVSLRVMLAGPLEVLLGSPMPDRSKVRGQTKSNLPVLQVWGFCTGLTTLSCKKPLLRKQQRVTYMNHLCRTSLRNPCHGQK